MGILHDLKIENDILIVADGWPSWFFALEGFKYSSVKVFMRSSLSIKEEFKSVGDAKVLLQESELERWFEDHPTCEMPVCIQS